MPDDQQTAIDLLVKRLIDETGVTEAQARVLVRLLGANNWSSLIREAKIMKRQAKF